MQGSEDATIPAFDTLASLPGVALSQSGAKSQEVVAAPSSCDPGSAVGGCQAPARTAAEGNPKRNPVVVNVVDQVAVRHVSSAEEDANELFNFLIADHIRSWNPKCRVAPAVGMGNSGDCGTCAGVDVVQSSAGLSRQGLRTAAEGEPLGGAQPGGSKRPRPSVNSGALVAAVPAVVVEPAKSLVSPGVQGVPATGVPTHGPSSKVEPAQRRPPASPCTAHPLCCHPSISFNLALTRGGEVAKPGKVLQHCASIIESKVSDQLTVFKVGITVNPVDRWCNTGFGYSQEGFTSMQLLHCERNSRACGFLEAALIAQFRGTLGCQNEASGGEGFSTQGDCETMCYLYAVFKGLSRTAPERRPPMATAVKSRCRPPPQC